MKLCAVIFPSRERASLAANAIHSFESRALNENICFRVRIDDDDPQREEYLKRLPNCPNTQVVIGPREQGWASGSKFCSELADSVPDYKWVWLINDDMELDCETWWDKCLEAIPDSGFIVQPEFHRLNASLYVKDERSCAPIVPNQCWKKFGHESIPAPADAMLPEILRKHGWTTAFLPRTTIIHNRNK